MAVTAVPDEIGAFLGAATPVAWLDMACERIPQLLLDHANCELKSASTALALIYRYPERNKLCWRMSRLAREELRHFEQVRKLLDARAIPFTRLSASRYASGLRDAARRDEPARLLDHLVVGALIEARSCERFAALAPRLPDDIARFYAGLLASEARHFQEYLSFARDECAVADAEVDARVAEFRAIEQRLITDPDPEFRFHSGAPAAA